MYQYNEEYDNDGVNQESQKREKKKKRHRKPKEDAYNEDEININYNNPNLAYEEALPPRKSEEENFDPSQPPKRKHRSKNKKREEEYIEEPTYPNNVDEYYENDNKLPETNYEKPTKHKREHRKKTKDTDDPTEEHYLNLKIQSPIESNNNYPFEDPNESVQNDEDEDHYEDEIDHSVGQSDQNETPVEPKPKKKSGGFMNIFASFKKKNKTKNTDKNINGNQWHSTPEIFNPAFDSQPGTLERKKISKSSKHLSSNKAHIILLDGMEVEFDVDQKMLGKYLFDEVCSYLDLIEKDFFGMTYVNSKLQTWFWLEMDKKISKQLSNADDWAFNFQVKFYPPEPVLLQEDITRYLLSLQVRQDVFTGKLPCSWITQALLGSFMVQSELGDFDELEHGEGIDYLREFEFVLNQSDQLLEKISELHKKHIGMSPDKADVKYLETAKRLEQYGVDLHPARDNDDVEILIGVCYQGVLIYRDRIRIGRFAWPKVLRISYKKNYFYLKIRSDRYDDSVAIVGFKLFNHNLAKRLWKNAVEQHTFFRMKEPQNQKPAQRYIVSGASTYGYTGKTLHQYRSMNILRNEPLKFDRSLTKRKTIGSMPAGLDKAGMQYSSMHSLNRSHPRDMTLGKTKSIEYLSAKRPGSNLGINQGSTSNINNNRLAPPQSKYPPYGGSVSSFNDDRHMSFQSGNSINAAESYMAINDDQVSLPPMPTIQQSEYTRPYKKHNSKTSRSNDVLSDDGINPQLTLSKPSRKQAKQKSYEDNNSDDGVNPQPEYAKVLKKQPSQPSRTPDVLSDEGNNNPQLEYSKPLKKQHSKAPRSFDVPSDDGIITQPEYTKPVKKHSSRNSRSNDVLPDEDLNIPPEDSKPLKKQHSKSRRQTEELSDEETSQPIYAKPHKKRHSKTVRPNEELSDDGFVSPTLQGKISVKHEIILPLPDPPVDTSQSDAADSPKKLSKKRGSQKSTGAPNSTRPMPPNHFKPPPPPPDPIGPIRSNDSSERSSPMEHNLPPPPPPIVELPQVTKSKPPPVKPKPTIKPKPKIVAKDPIVIAKNTVRYNDDSSNDDML